MFTLKEGTCIFLHMKTTTKEAIIPKSECTDEEMWEMGCQGLDPSPSEDYVGDEADKPSPSLKTPVLFHTSSHVTHKNLKCVHVCF